METPISSGFRSSRFKHAQPSRTETSETLAAPLAQYIQQLQRSEAGAAYFMMSDRLLDQPELSDLLAVPEGLAAAGGEMGLGSWEVEGMDHS